MHRFAHARCRQALQAGWRRPPKAAWTATALQDLMQVDLSSEDRLRDVARQSRCARPSRDPDPKIPSRMRSSKAEDLEPERRITRSAPSRRVIILRALLGKPPSLRSLEKQRSRRWTPTARTWRPTLSPSRPGKSGAGGCKLWSAALGSGKIQAARPRTAGRSSARPSEYPLVGDWRRTAAVYKTAPQSRRGRPLERRWRAVGRCGRSVGVGADRRDCASA